MLLRKERIFRVEYPVVERVGHYAVEVSDGPLPLDSSLHVLAHVQYVLQLEPVLLRDIRVLVGLHHQQDVNVLIHRSVVLKARNAIQPRGETGQDPLNLLRLLWKIEHIQNCP